MANRVVNPPQVCRSPHLSPFFRIMIRSETELSESESLNLQTVALCGRRLRSCCSRPRLHFSSWGKSLELKHHSFFSAISRRTWQLQSPRVGEMSSLILRDSPTRPNVSGFPTRTPKQRLRLRGSTGA